MRAFKLFLTTIRAREGDGLSLSRLLALLFGLAGILVALLYPSEAATVVALIGGGSVSIIFRERGKAPDA